MLEPRLLLEPKCAICGGAKPEWRSTTHWYLDLRKLEDDVRRYVEGNNNLSPNAKQMSLAMLKEGLRPRAITRDNKWAYPPPPSPPALRARQSTCGSRPCWAMYQQ